MPEENASLAQPATLSQLRFTSDFTPVESDSGGRFDPVETGSLLAVVHRLLSEVATHIGAGALRSVYAWASGEGYHLQTDADGETVLLYKGGVTGWEDLEPAWQLDGANLLSHQCPRICVQSEVLTLLEDAHEVEWIGLRDHVTNGWEHFAREEMDSATFQQATLALLQAETSLRNQHWPASRLCLNYANGCLWMFGNVHKDYLVVYTESSEKPQQFWRVRQAGEAFLLT